MLYSLAMFTLPFLVFFVVQRFMINHYQLELFHANCAAVVGAVITTNAIIAAYAYQGFIEKDDDPVPVTESEVEEKEKDKDQ